MAFETPSTEGLLDLALALGLGALIGLERERHRKERLMLAGVRTYPLVALCGLVTAILAAQSAEPALLSVGAFIMGGFALLMYYVRQKGGTVGLTSPIALFATYFVGVLVGSGRQWEAILAGIAIALLLFTKERLHRLAEVLTPQEMEGALYFLVLAFILYPITPAEPIDPWDLLNLQRALLIVLLVSAISFASFLVVRRYGSEFGLPFSGFLGGLVNSEATTASLARLHAEKKTLHRAALMGVLLTTGTMFLRNLAIAGIADPSLAFLRAMAPAALIASLVYLVWAFAQWRRGTQKGTAEIPLKSPFAFRPAITFASWFTLVTVGTILLVRTDALGEYGLYAAALGGLVSAGAVTASMGAIVATGEAPIEPAAATAVLACLLSAMNKPFIAQFSTTGLASRLVLPTVISVALGCGAVALLYLT